MEWIWLVNPQTKICQPSWNTCRENSLCHGECSKNIGCSNHHHPISMSCSNLPSHANVQNANSSGCNDSCIFPNGIPHVGRGEEVSSHDTGGVLARSSIRLLMETSNSWILPSNLSRFLQSSSQWYSKME